MIDFQSYVVAMNNRQRYYLPLPASSVDNFLVSR